MHETADCAEKAASLEKLKTVIGLLERYLAAVKEKKPTVSVNRAHSQTGYRIQISLIECTAYIITEIRLIRFINPKFNSLSMYTILSNVRITYEFRKYDSYFYNILKFNIKQKHVAKMFCKFYSQIIISLICHQFTVSNNIFIIIYSYMYIPDPWHNIVIIM